MENEVSQFGQLNFNELDYNNDAIATIDASLRMDRCIQVY